MSGLRCKNCGNDSDFARDIDSFSSMLVCNKCDAVLVEVDGRLRDGEIVEDREGEG